MYGILTSIFENCSNFSPSQITAIRSFFAFLIAFSTYIAFGKKFIAHLKLLQKSGQPIREDGPKSHLETKRGTPTMGGVLIIASILLSFLICADLSNQYSWIILLTTFSSAALGFFDDYKKLKKSNHRGLSAKQKLIWQLSMALAASVWIESITPQPYHLTIPMIFYHTTISLYWAYLLFSGLVIVGSSNAVNLTDGLDGLATIPIIISLACLAYIAHITDTQEVTTELRARQIPGTSELIVIASMAIGACLGFLWYNAPPAKIFMGDVGSLALGSMLGTMSVALKQELVFAVIGGLFVMEALSVILQVGSYKLRNKKRIFKMAPIHHHFEQLGWPEPTVVVRFWIISFVCAILGIFLF